jgi:hypothetical protein
MSVGAMKDYKLKFRNVHASHTHILADCVFALPLLGKGCTHALGITVGWKACRSSIGDRQREKKDKKKRTFFAAYYSDAHSFRKITVAFSRTADAQQAFGWCS